MRFSLPIRANIDPMKALLVATVVGDPEFDAIEPQRFNDPVNGTGLRVLRYRKNGKIDVYFQRGVIVDAATFNLGTGIQDFEETTIDPARFEIGERSVDVEFS